MNEFPMWWLVLSSLFFLAVTVLFGAVCALLFTLVKVLKGLQPQVSSLIVQVRGLVDRVDQLTEKVDSLAQSAKGLTDSAKSTVDDVGGKARALVSLVDGVSSPLAKRIESALPYIGTLLAAWRIVASLRSHGKPKAK